MIITKTNKIQTHSIYKVTILEILYKTNITKKNKKRVTTCKIRWINPTNGNIQVSYGSTVCNPNERFNTEIGQRIAESRAKQQMYHEYCKFIAHISKIVYRKHHELKRVESLHEHDIIKSLSNK